MKRERERGRKWREREGRSNVPRCVTDHQRQRGEEEEREGGRGGRGILNALHNVFLHL